jgi:hypothetical protein
MKFKYKLIGIAILALLSGTAFASPLLVVPMDVEAFPRVPEGPKADFSIDVVYAGFEVVNWEQNRTVSRTAFNYTTWEIYTENVTETTQYTNVTYMVVANITNLSDMDAKMYETSFAAAQKINIEHTALGGVSFDKGYPRDPGTNFGGIVAGVWLDGKWVNTTWVPGKGYPYNLYPVMDPQHRVQYIVPELPQNASEEGTWIEGVPIAEYYDHTHLTATHMYINGAWIDVTGRVEPGKPQPMVLSLNTLASGTLSSYTALYTNQGNSSVGPTTELPGWKMYNSNGPQYKAYGWTDFDKTWQPHQSKLIVFTGTRMISSDSTANETLTLMEDGAIDLFGSITNYITNMPVDGVYFNTVSTATWLQTISLEKTPRGYLYNTILAPGEVFQIAPNGIEAYITQES